MTSSEAQGFKFEFPTSWRQGRGISAEISSVLKEIGCQKPLLLTDQILLQQGVVQPIMESLEKDHIAYQLNATINQEPTVALFDTLIQSLDLQSFDAIIAVGGGSILDVSKGVAVIASFGGHIRDYSGFNKVPDVPRVKTIAVPTTSGTGSEISDGIVLIDEARHTKFLVISKKICPTVALTDPELTLSMPPRVTACSGTDALVHAIESYISKNANSVTEVFALKAIELIGSALQTVYKNGEDVEARESMQKGATMAMTAGMNSYLGLCHALAMPLCALYHMPHGEAVGMALPAVLRYNSSVAEEKIKVVLKTLGMSGSTATGLVKIEDGLDRLRAFLDRIGIAKNLSPFGYQETHRVTIVKETMNSAQRATNPRSPTEQDIIEIVQQIV